MMSHPWSDSLLIVDILCLSKNIFVVIVWIRHWTNFSAFYFLRIWSLHFLVFFYFNRMFRKIFNFNLCSKQKNWIRSVFCRTWIIVRIRGMPFYWLLFWGHQIGCCDNYFVAIENYNYVIIFLLSYYSIIIDKFLCGFEFPFKS